MFALFLVCSLSALSALLCCGSPEHTGNPAAMLVLRGWFSVSLCAFAFGAVLVYGV